jgi:hypothetical protein
MVDNAHLVGFGVAHVKSGFDNLSGHIQGRTVLFMVDPGMVVVSHFLAYPSAYQQMKSAMVMMAMVMMVLAFGAGLSPGQFSVQVTMQSLLYRARCAGDRLDTILLKKTDCPVAHPTG